MAMKQAVGDELVLSTENGNDTNEQSSIWASILRDVKSSTKKAPATKSLVVLGDNESGRTTLVARLQGNDDPKRGAGLEYHYIDVRDDDRDDTPKLGVWILDGDVACSAPLLKFAIKPDTLENAMIILVASMTQPWSLLTTLQKWIALIEEHIERLKIDPTRLREMRDRLQYDFQHYAEPNESSQMLTSSTSSTTIKSGTNAGRVPSSISTNSLASATQLSPINGDEQVVLPLPDGVLTKSMGIPIVVVITKCDAMSTLEKENDYKDEYFDFMQHHLRKFCLEYGAALFYTSVKEKKNIDKLYKYVVHKCYGYPFTSAAAIVERDAIFIPLGWDNPKKADILLENLHRLKPTDNYSDVFVKPVTRRPLQRDNEIITAEDDQEFLAKLQGVLNRAASPARTDENTTPSVPRPPGTSPTPGTPNVAASPRPRVPGAPTAPANEGALANFFNSLLTRKTGAAGTPTTVNPSSASRQIISSPTTPSKRLQQQPLTYTVTPPGRTRTPSSYKGFPSMPHVESPTKSLPSVFEQVSTVEKASTDSVPVIRTPVEETKLVDNASTTDDNESSLITTTHTMEHDPNTAIDSSKTESKISAESSTIEVRKDANIESSVSSSQLSPSTENQPSVQTDASNDEIPLESSNSSPLIPTNIQEIESEALLSNQEVIESTSTLHQSAVEHSSQSDAHLNTENQDNVSSTDELLSSTSIREDNNDNTDQPEILEHQSLLSSSNSIHEDTQMLNDEGDKQQRTSPVVPQEEPVDSSINHDLSRHDEEQPTVSSRHNSIVGSTIPLTPLTSQSEEPQQDNDKLLATTNSDNPLPDDIDNTMTNVQESSVPVELASESLSLHTEENRLESSQMNSSDDAGLLAQEHDEISTSSEPEQPLSQDLRTNISEETQLNEASVSNDISNNDNNDVTATVENTDEDLAFTSTHKIDSSPVSDNYDSSLLPTSSEASMLAAADNSKIELPQIEDNLHDAMTDDATTILETKTSETILETSPDDIVRNEHDSNDETESTVLTSQTSAESHIIHSEDNENEPSIAQEESSRSRLSSTIVEEVPEQIASESVTDQEDNKEYQSQSAKTEEQQELNEFTPSVPEQSYESHSLNIEESHITNEPDILTTQPVQKEDASESHVLEDEQKSESLTMASATIEESTNSASESPVIQQSNDNESPSIEEQHTINRPPSPIVSTEQELNNDENTLESSVVTEEQESLQQSPLVIAEATEMTASDEVFVENHGIEEAASSSSIIEKTEEPVRSEPSAVDPEEATKNSSLSPTIEQKDPSPLSQEDERKSRPASPTVAHDYEPIQSSDKHDVEQSDRSMAATINHDKLDDSTSPIHETDEMSALSAEPLEENLPSSDLIKNNETIVHSTEDALPVPDIDSEQEQDGRIQEPKENAQSELSPEEEVEKLNQDGAEHHPSSSQIFEESIAQQFDNHTENDTQLDGSVPFINQNNSSEIKDHKVHETDANDNISINNNQTAEKSPSSTSSTEISTEELMARSVPSTKSSSKPSSSLSHHVESEPMLNHLPSDDVEHSNITRSQSSTSLPRPNTLSFLPNDHDLDGLYISSEYDDDNETPQNKEHNRHSAPTTSNEEYRHSNLLHKNNIDEQTKSISPNDAIKPLSIVEKSKIEDTENPGADPTNSKNV